MTSTDLWKFEQEQIDEWLKENTDYKAGAKKWAEDTAADVKKAANDAAKAANKAAEDKIKAAKKVAEADKKAADEAAKSAKKVVEEKVKDYKKLAKAAKKTADDMKKSIDQAQDKQTQDMLQAAFDLTMLYGETRKTEQAIEEGKKKIWDDLEKSNERNPDLRNAFIEQIKSSFFQDHPVTTGVDYVVDRAFLNCNYSGVDGSNADELSVMNVSKHVCVYAGKDTIMHDADCLPVEHITFKFKNCNAPDYEEELSKILAGLAASPEVPGDLEATNLRQDQIRLYQDAIRLYRDKGKKLCVHPMLYKWMEADEKFEIKGFFNSLYEIDKLIRGLVNSLKNLKKEICKITESISFLYSYEGSYGPMDPNNINDCLPKGRYSDIISIATLTNKISEDLIFIIEQYFEEFHDCVLCFGTGKQLEVKLPKISAEFKNIRSKKWNTINYTNYAEIEKAINEGVQYEKRDIEPADIMDAFLIVVRSTMIAAFKRKELTEENLSIWFGVGGDFWYNKTIDVIISELGNLDKELKGEAVHPITCNSFLVCRLGGKVTVQDGGQWFYIAKTALFPNFKIMVYDIFEDIFGPHQPDGKLGTGGLAGKCQASIKLMELQGTVDTYTKEDLDKQLEFYKQMEVCLKALEEAVASPEGITIDAQDCPLFVKISIVPQYVIDDETRWRNAGVGIGIAALALTGAVAGTAMTGAAALLAGGTLSFLTMVWDWRENAWGIGDDINTADLTAQSIAGVVNMFTDSVHPSSKLGVFNKTVGKMSSSLSTMNAIYTFISAVNLLFQSSSDRYYPGRIVIDFIGLEYAYECEQNYNRDGSLNGSLQSILTPSQYYNDIKRFYSTHPGFIIDDAEIQKLYNEFS